MQWQGTLGCGGTWWDCKHLTGDTSTPFARQGALSQLGLKTHWHTPHHHYPNYTWQFRLILSLLTLRRTAITMLNQFFYPWNAWRFGSAPNPPTSAKATHMPWMDQVENAWNLGSWLFMGPVHHLTTGVSLNQRGGTSSGPWCKLTKPENSQFLGKP
jgi:hypothetical protein